jgi:DIM1 family U5 snRNP protein
MAHHVVHLHSAETVDAAIISETETERLVVIRFGHSLHSDCLRVDAAMAAAAERVGPLASLYAVDIEELQDYNAMYEVHERPCTVMFFYANWYVDVRGITDDIDWAAYGGDKFADIVEAVHAREIQRWAPTRPPRLGAASSTVARF